MAAAAGRKPRGRSDRIRDPKIKTSIEIIIRTAYPGQVRETNGVDPQNIPMPDQVANQQLDFLKGSIRTYTYTFLRYVLTCFNDSNRTCVSTYWIADS